MTGRAPARSTDGGTSDARFIKDVCPVCEFGMVGESAHKVDENVPLADIEVLTRIYQAVVGRALFDGALGGALGGTPGAPG